MEHKGDGSVILKKLNDLQSANAKMMQLSIQDRLLISSLLPQKGSMKLLQLAKDIVEKTTIRQDEIVACGLKFDDEIKSYTWRDNIANKFLFTNEEIELLKKQIEFIDAEGSIPLQMFDLCKKIKEY